jgi:chromate transporter
MIPRLRNSRWAGLFLDAVTAASIGLMLAVIVKLVQPTLVDWRAWLIAVAIGVVALRWKVAPVWLVLAGAITGRLLY